jgi:hypothetical protein
MVSYQGIASAMPSKGVRPKTALAAGLFEPRPQRLKPRAGCMPEGVPRYESFSPNRRGHSACLQDSRPHLTVKSKATEENQDAASQSSRVDYLQFRIFGNIPSTASVLETMRIALRKF